MKWGLSLDFLGDFSHTFARLCNTPELISISDRVIVINDGKITGEFTSDQITQTNVMKAAIAN